MKDMKGIKTDPLVRTVIGCAIEVHRELGPGLMESAYEQCLARELSLKEVGFRLQVPLPVLYKGIKIDCGYRIDVLVEERLLLEIKSVEMLLGVHKAQVLTYMKLAGISQGLLVNFNVTKLTNGLQSFLL